MMSDMTLFRWAPAGDLIQALATGVAVSAGILLVIGMLRALNAASVWLAAVRVEALAAQCGLPQGEALRRPFLYAFRHSPRLRRLAETYAEMYFRTPRPDEENGHPQGLRAIGSDESRANAGQKTLSAAAAVDPAIGAAFNYFPGVAMALGAVGIVVIAAIGLFGAKLETIGFGDRFNISLFLSVMTVCATFALGCGITGLASPLVRRLVTRLERRNGQRLQWAVVDCLAAAAALQSEQTRLLKEIGRFARLLEEEPRARARHAALVNDAVTNVEKMIRLARDSGATGGDGAGTAAMVRELTLDVARLQDRIDVALSQQSTLMLTDGALSAIADFQHSLERLTAASTSIRESSLRLASIVDSVADMTSSVMQYVKDWESAPVQPDDAASHPAIAELNELIKEFEKNRQLLGADSRDDDDEP